MGFMKLRWMEVYFLYISKCLGTNSFKYCNTFLGNAAKIHTRKISVIQKRLLKIILRVERHTNSHEVFVLFRTLSLDDLYFQNSLKFICRFVHKLLTPIFWDMYPYHDEFLSRQTKNTTVFYVPFAHLCSTKNSQLTNGQKLWNCQPTEIWNAENLSTFKLRLKYYLRSEYL